MLRFFTLCIILWTSGHASSPAGKPVDSMSLLGLSASSISTKNGVVVIFLSSRCPCSKSHEGVITKLSQTFSDFEFVGVHSNANETTPKDTEHFSKSGIPFRVIRDGDGKLVNHFKALKTPHAFVLSPQGEIVYSGGVDDSENASDAENHFLRSALESVRNGKKPDPAQTRALGCAIKRKG